MGASGIIYTILKTFPLYRIQNFNLKYVSKFIAGPSVLCEYIRRSGFICDRDIFA